MGAAVPAALNAMCGVMAGRCAAAMGAAAPAALIAMCGVVATTVFEKDCGDVALLHASTSTATMSPFSTHPRRSNPWRCASSLSVFKGNCSNGGGSSGGGDGGGAGETADLPEMLIRADLRVAHLWLPLRGELCRGFGQMKS